jgi:hypothetical protein
MKEELSSRRIFFQVFFTTMITIKLSKIKSCYSHQDKRKSEQFLSSENINFFLLFYQTQWFLDKKILLGHHQGDHRLGKAWEFTLNFFR